MSVALLNSMVGKVIPIFFVCPTVEDVSILFNDFSFDGAVSEQVLSNSKCLFGQTRGLVVSHTGETIINTKGGMSYSTSVLTMQSQTGSIGYTFVVKEN